MHDPIDTNITYLKPQGGETHAAVTVYSCTYIVINVRSTMTRTYNITIQVTTSEACVYAMTESRENLP